MDINFIRENPASEAFQRAQEGAMARQRQDLDTERAQLDMQQTRAEMPSRLRSVQADADLSRTRADVAAQTAPYEVSTARENATQSEQQSRLGEVNVENTEIEQVSKVFDLLDAGDVQTARSLAQRYGVDLPDGVVNNRLLIRQIKTLTEQAKTLYPNSPRRQEQYLSEAVKGLVSGSQQSQSDNLADPAYPMRVPNAPDPQDCNGTAPKGYRYTADGTMEYIPGGPADPKNRAPKTLSPTAQKELFEADEAAMAGQNVVSALDDAIGLNSEAYSGPAAGVRGWLGSQVGMDRANATEELNNLITTQALDQLRATFGAAPTEGERKILLEIQGSIDKAPAVRASIFERAKKLALRRIAFNREKAEALRSGRYFTESPMFFEDAPTDGSEGWGGYTDDTTTQSIDADPTDDLSDARQAPDGNYYVQRNGKYYRVDP